MEQFFLFTNCGLELAEGTLQSTYTNERGEKVCKFYDEEEMYEWETESKNLLFFSPREEKKARHRASEIWQKRDNYVTIMLVIDGLRRSLFGNLKS